MVEWEAEERNMTTIKTAFGNKSVSKRAGVCGEYYLTLPTPSAPNGEWWTCNPQRGFVPVPSNSRALVAAIAESAS